MSINNNANINQIDKAILDKEINKRIEMQYTKNNLWEYAKIYDSKFFHDGKIPLMDVASKIQLVSEGRIRKLAISMPPRFGKSYLISVACSWLLGNNPSGCIMRNAYGETLANKFSYDIMAMIESDTFKTVFEGVKMSKKKKSVDCWALNKSRQFAYFGTGVGGATTGYGANIAGIVDDPVKNMTDAMSPKVLETCWDWFFSTHRTRYEQTEDGKSTCPEIIISTMWSKDDLINRITDVEGTVDNGGDWTFISYPAMNDNEESICEDVITTERLKEIRKDCMLAGQDFIWETMYMNNVVQKYGNLFPKRDLMFIEDDLFPREYDTVFGYCDPADKGKNATCSVMIGVKNGLGYILDVVYTKKGYEYYKELLIIQIMRFLPYKYTIESNKDGRIIAVEIRNEVNRRLDIIRKMSPSSIIDVNILTKAESKNKELRISLASNTIKTMMVFRKNYERNSFYGFFIKDLTNYLAEGNNDIDDAPDTLAGAASTLRPKGNAMIEVLNGR